jgi:hypothetical protein
MTAWDEKKSLATIRALTLPKQRENIVNQPTNMEDRSAVAQALDKTVVAITERSAIVIAADLDADERNMVMRTLQLCTGFVAAKADFLEMDWTKLNTLATELTQILGACGFATTKCLDKTTGSREEFLIGEGLADLLKAVRTNNVGGALKALLKQFTDNVLKDAKTSDAGRPLVIAANHFPAGSTNVRVVFTIVELKQANLNSSFLWLSYGQVTGEVRTLTVEGVLNSDRHRAVANTIDEKLNSAARQLINTVILPNTLG